jgi:hypothetical protein
MWLSDPDSRAMAAYTKVGVGYNAGQNLSARPRKKIEAIMSSFSPYARAHNARARKAENRPNHFEFDAASREATLDRLSLCQR